MSRRGSPAPCKHRISAKCILGRPWLSGRPSSLSLSYGIAICERKMPAAAPVGDGASDGGTRINHDWNRGNCPESQPSDTVPVVVSLGAIQFNVVCAGVRQFLKRRVEDCIGC